MVDDNKCELEFMDSTTHGANASSSVSANNIETGMIVTKAKSLRSAVWKEFSRTINESGIQRAVCQHCKVSMDCNSRMGTTRLKNHLKACPKRPNLELGQQRLVIDGKSNDGKYNFSTFKFDSDKSRLDLANMIILHEYPFCIVSHPGFQKFIKGLQPQFKLLSRNTVRSDCIHIYEDEMTKLRNILEKTNGRISLTSDMWTSSCHKRGYLCLTAHYIDNTWEIKKKVLNFVMVETPHTGEKLASVIKDCLLKWNIDRKLFSITLDNCSTNDIMVTKLIEWLLENDAVVCNGKFFQVRCAAHILNLVVQDGLKEISDVIDKIRQNIKYIKASPARCEFFDGAVCHAKVNSEKKLCLDVPTRWNSTFLMLEVALEYKEAFGRFQELDRYYHLTPTEDEWKKATIIHDSLQKFYDATNVIFAVNYPTSNIFFKEFCEIKMEIEKMCSISDICLLNMAMRMKTKFDKYWDTCNLILAVAVVFDPHYKMKIIEFYYRQFYEDEAYEYVYAIKNYLCDLYDEYKTTYALKTRCTGTGYIVDVEKDSDASSFASLIEFSSNKKPKTSTLDDFLEQSSQSQHTKSDLELYLEEPIYPKNNPIDILTWWKVNAPKYPVLSKMACDILAIPISTVASESTFSTGGRMLDLYRSRLGTKTVEALICAQDWLRDQAEDDSDLPTPLPEEEAPFASAYIESES